MSEIYPSLDCLEFVVLLPALVTVGLLAHHSVYRIIDRYLPHTFIRFITLRYTVTFCALFCAVITLL